MTHLVLTVIMVKLIVVAWCVMVAAGILGIYIGYPDGLGISFLYALASLNVDLS